jgi:hypothetical protein
MLDEPKRRVLHPHVNHHYPIPAETRPPLEQPDNARIRNGMNVVETAAAQALPHRTALPAVVQKRYGLATP